MGVPGAPPGRRDRRAGCAAGSVRRPPTTPPAPRGNSCAATGLGRLPLRRTAPMASANTPATPCGKGPKVVSPRAHNQHRSHKWTHGGHEPDKHSGCDGGTQKVSDLQFSQLLFLGGCFPRSPSTGTGPFSTRHGRGSTTGFPACSPVLSGCCIRRATRHGAFRNCERGHHRFWSGQSTREKDRS